MIPSTTQLIEKADAIYYTQGQKDKNGLILLVREFFSDIESSDDDSVETWAQLQVGESHPLREKLEKIFINAGYTNAVIELFMIARDKINSILIERINTADNIGRPSAMVNAWDDARNYLKTYTDGVSPNPLATVAACIRGYVNAMVANGYEDKDDVLLDALIDLKNNGIEKNKQLITGPLTAKLILKQIEAPCTINFLRSFQEAMQLIKKHRGDLDMPALGDGVARIIIDYLVLTSKNHQEYSTLNALRESALEVLGRFSSPILACLFDSIFDAENPADRPLENFDERGFLINNPDNKQ